ncbi:MAG TPA: hypothetical protein VHC95_02820 [Opitutales bacterium]|nr:hypothetical protein [Opitutales bacterium]
MRLFLLLSLFLLLANRALAIFTEWTSDDGKKTILAEQVGVDAKHNTAQLKMEDGRILSVDLSKFIKDDSSRGRKWNPALLYEVPNGLTKIFGLTFIQCRSIFGSESSFSDPALKKAMILLNGDNVTFYSNLRDHNPSWEFASIYSDNLKCVAIVIDHLYDIKHIDDPIVPTADFKAWMKLADGDKNWTRDAEQNRKALRGINNDPAPDYWKNSKTGSVAVIYDFFVSNLPDDRELRKCRVIIEADGAFGPIPIYSKLPKSPPLPPAESKIIVDGIEVAHSTTPDQ